MRGLVRPSSLDRTQSLASVGVEIAPGDLTDRESLDAACRGIDTVYHIAATFRTAGQRDSIYREINVGGTENLLQAAHAAGVRRFVHCSTGGVHGHIADPPATEDAPLAPGDIYQVTKLEAETLVREAGARTGLEVVVARPMAIYGPGDTRFLKMFRGIARRRFPFLGSGEIFYHLTYIDDLVEGFRLCAETPEAAGRTYLLAGPSYTTLNELAAVIAAEVGVPHPPCTCRCGPCGWRVRPARRCASRWGSSRPCTGVASTSSRRAGRSTRLGRGPSLGTTHGSTYGPECT